MQGANCFEVCIHYRINEDYWHRGIAIETVRLLIEYLCGSIGIQTLKTFVMPENVHSEKALLKNGFVRESDTIQGQNWGGQESVALNVFTYNKADNDS